MGELARAALAAGGEVTGVIPEFLTRLEVMHRGLSETIITDSMHTRKRLMFERADAFVTLPGGLGTLDETIEIITWRQLGLHDKTVVICDIDGSAQPLISAIEAAIGWGFATQAVRELFVLADGVGAVLERLSRLSVAAVVSSTRL